MALFIKFGSGVVAQTTIGNKIPSHFQFHSGQSTDQSPQAVVEVQADGDELKRILSWDNMPNSRQSVQRYFGDHARFIVANWN